MSVFGHSDTGSGRSGRLILIIALAVVVGGALAWWLLPGGDTAPEPAERRAAAPAPAPEAEPEPASPAERAAPRERRASPAPGPPSAPEPPPPPPAPTGVLRVTSDVPGASVFLDRKFLGRTPFETSGLSRGPHQVNVSAEGYDSHVEQVEIGDAPAEVAVRFKEVRLNAAVPVEHKHGMGSCTGRLVATVQGLRYETSHRSDGFTLGFPQLETFEVDYLQKNLRVKQRGGRTWNFTHPEGNADALFVFHRDVAKARERLAGGP